MPHSSLGAPPSYSYPYYSDSELIMASGLSAPNISSGGFPSSYIYSNNLTNSSFLEGSLYSNSSIRSRHFY